MIRVTRLNGQEFYVNADMIEFVEATPDTVISLYSSRRVIVRETPEEIQKAIIAYKKEILVHLPVIRQARDEVEEV